MELIKLASIDALNAFTDQNAYALVIVSRNNCAGCVSLDNAIKSNAQLKAALEGVAVAVAKLEEVPALVTTFGLRMAPSMLLFKQDDEVARLSGFDSPAKLLAALQEQFPQLAVAA